MKNLWSIIVFVYCILSFCGCLEETNSNSNQVEPTKLEYSITRGCHRVKIRVYYSNLDMLNDAIIEKEDNYFKFIHAGRTLNIPVVPKGEDFYIGNVEYIYRNTEYVAVIIDTSPHIEPNLDIKRGLIECIIITFIIPTNMGLDAAITNTIP